MKRILIPIFFILGGIFITSCGAERCACNTFGKVEKKSIKQNPTASKEGKSVPLN